MHGAELLLTCASAGTGDHTGRLENTEDLVAGNNYEQLGQAMHGYRLRQDVPRTWAIP